MLCLFEQSYFCFSSSSEAKEFFCFKFPRSCPIFSNELMSDQESVMNFITHYSLLIYLFTPPLLHFHYYFCNEFFYKFCSQVTFALSANGCLSFIHFFFTDNKHIRDPQ